MPTIGETKQGYELGYKNDKKTKEMSYEEYVTYCQLHNDTCSSPQVGGNATEALV